MQNDNFSKKIKQFAAELGNAEDFTIYHYLYGIIKIVKMSPVMRDKVIFKTDEEHAEIESISVCLENIGLLKDDVLENIKVLAKHNNTDAEREKMRDIIEANDSPSKVIEAIAKLGVQDIKNIGKSEACSSNNNKAAFHNLISETRFLYQKLCKHIKGQDEAVRVFVQGYFQSQLIKDKGSNKPSTAFLFGGPPGTGKSTLAEQAANILNLPFLRIELNIAAADTQGDELVASMLGGQDCSPSRISSFVDKNPKCIILFNEIDSCDPRILSALDKILESGVVDDKIIGKEISFKDAIIILTTTLGKSLYVNNKGKNLSVLPRAEIMDSFKSELADNTAGEVLKEFLTNHFIGGNVVMFNHVSIHHLAEIAKNGFEDLISQMEANYGYNIYINPDVINVFLYSNCNSLDAHSVVQQSKAFLKNEFYEFGRHIVCGCDEFSKISSIEFKVDVPEQGDTLRSLFVNEKKTQVLLIADRNKVTGISADEEECLLFAENYEQAMEILKSNEISYAIVDLYYKQDVQTLRYLSLDDIRSVGLECFEKLRKQLPDLPFYLIAHRGMDQEDQATFMQRGARGFIDFDVNKNQLVTIINDTAQQIYMQEQVDRLARKGRVLAFNTAQEITEDGTKAIITFYEFYTRSVSTTDNIHLSLVSDMHPKERLEEITGAANAKKELKYLCQYLQSPRKFIINEGKSPKGVLLFGMPEGGKAALAKAIAGECDAAFIPLSTSYLLSVAPPNAADYINAAFVCAKQCSPAVVFLEDIDNIANGKAPILDTFKDIILENIENLNKDILHPVLFVCSVDWDRSYINSDESGIDSTLLHYMDYKIYVNLPDKDERKSFILKELEHEGITTISDAAIMNICDRTPGISVSMLKDFMSLAVRNAKRTGEVINDTIFIESLDEFVFGEKHDWNEADYKDTAIHEAGHAYMYWKYGKKSSFITIISRGHFGGYTMPQINEKEDGCMTKEQMLQEIRIDLAGRAAEIVFFGQEAGINTGVSSDLQQATRCALAMICTYGMDEDALVNLPVELVLQSSLSGRVIKKVSTLLKEELENTIKIVEEGKDAIQALADRLLDKNQLTGPEVEAIFEAYTK